LPQASRAEDRLNFGPRRSLPPWALGALRYQDPGVRLARPAPARQDHPQTSPV